MDNIRHKGVESVEVASGGNNPFCHKRTICLIRNPVRCGVKVADAIPVPVKGEHGDEAYGRGQSEEGLLEDDAVSRSNGKFNCAKPYGINTLPAETFDRVRRDGHKCLKIRMLR